MTDHIAPFDGFGSQAVRFFEELATNNNKAFFTSHRAVYDQHVREPLERLLAEVDEEFGDGKVFRPNRDVRFSHDKSPYKLAGAAAIGDNDQSSAVYYVQIGPDGLFVASGIYLMTRDQLARFYAAVDDDAAGKKLEKLVRTTRAAGLEVGGSALKTGPRGYPKDHPRIELLRHKSLTVSQTYSPDQDWLFTPSALERVVQLWRDAAPINGWLAKHVGHPEER